MKMKKNLAIIGCGRIAQAYLKIIEKIPSAKLTAVCDASAPVAKSVGEQSKCRAYTDYKRMVDEEELDAVVICTPPNVHANISVYALERGVHVLCEKPLAIRLADASLMVQAARRHKVVLMMASKFRYVEDVVQAKGMLESGLIGKPVLFENIFCSRVDMTKRWNSNKKISGGGVLIDNGTHSIDIARFLLGPIVYVQAQFGPRVQDTAVEDTASIYLRNSAGVRGTVDLSWSINKEVDSYINLYGTEGTICIGWKQSKLKLYEKDKWEPFGHGYDKMKAFSNQIKRFLGCITREEKPIVSALDGLESVRVIETAYWSSRVNKWLKVEKK